VYDAAKRAASRPLIFRVENCNAMRKKRKPVHSGEILCEEFMVPLELSMNRMAMDLRVPVTRIAEIIHERRGITADTALRLAGYFQNAPVFCMNHQTRYDLEVAEDEIAVKVVRDVRPLEVPAS
jgi:addiction module HigA family antidote